MRVCDEKQRRQVGLNFVGMCWRRRGSGMEGHIGCSPQQRRNTFWPALAFCFKVELGLFSKAFLLFAANIAPTATFGCDNLGDI